MATQPAAPAAGMMRVVRIAHHVTEAYVTASTPAQALALAKALKPTDWYTRPVLQPAGEDVFEYNVVSSDGL
ncbi:hypothetical protein [Methylobacterium ajmalii]|jgi:hypothetical protein|uniref:hypothetical protein n=1 Tax=Methylobacterium ajmalii TaxID=2738439 RepID=UPI00190D2E38|nr:hypothetical protein [Methylobacterium ajmalii]MBK3400442.1 hypothetical protein [Methylobacterium ajmalii]MBK3407516.1 hypothetical protein [Methylobacterium ajmalii]MBK3422136.1 hypothetical protein [Methylobacterium ajmalii]MBZ6416653.1 hypothetical protein [Methylobacterium sp.]